jgi:hypothetical protein
MGSRKFLFKYMSIVVCVSVRNSQIFSDLLSGYTLTS